MHRLPFVKKFLFVYLISVTLVLIYFIIKMLFSQEREIEYKSFAKPLQEVKTQVVIEKSKDERTPLLVLPKK